MKLDYSKLADLGAERAVLAAVLLSPELLPTLAAVLGEGAFYLERHGQIWDAYRYLDGEDMPIDLRTVSARLVDMGIGDESGILVFLSGLDLELPDLGRVEHYARVVRKRAEARRVADQCQRTLGQLFEDGTGAGRIEDIAHRLGAVAQGVSLALSSQKPTDAGTAADAVLDSLMDREENEGEANMPGLSTMWPAWDRKTGGLCPGELVVIAGLPGMGKSTVLSNLALHVGRAAPVALVSLEMTERELIGRMLAGLGGVDQTPMKSGPLSQDQWSGLLDAREALKARDISFLCHDVGTVEAIDAAIRKLAARTERFGLVGIDYLQLVRTARRYQNENYTIAHITRSLKRLAVDLGIPIVLLSQLSRAAAKSGGRPKAHQLRDSGAIEQDADMIVFIHDDNPPDEGMPIPEPRHLVAIVEKHRGGESGYTVPIVFERSTGRMLQRAPHWRAA